MIIWLIFFVVGFGLGVGLGYWLVTGRKAPSMRRRTSLGRFVEEGGGAPGAMLESLKDKLESLHSAGKD